MTFPPPGLPKYRHVANAIRDEIRAGTLAPGARLPSESELETRFGYDRGTIRRAIALLRREGLIRTEQGKPATVREQRLVTRDIAEGLRREYDAIWSGIPDEVGVFRALTDIDGHVEVDTRYDWVEATVDLAEAFGLQPDDPLLRRRYSYRLDGTPDQIVDSYLSGELVTGTPIESIDQESPGRGTMRQLADIGVHVERAESFIGARIATPEEAAALHLPEADPVFITRRILYGSRPGSAQWPAITPGTVVSVGDGLAPAGRRQFVIVVDFPARAF